jgi:hypothetical protein
MPVNRRIVSSTIVGALALSAVAVAGGTIGNGPDAAQAAAPVVTSSQASPAAPAAAAVLPGVPAASSSATSTATSSTAPTPAAPTPAAPTATPSASTATSSAPAADAGTASADPTDQRTSRGAVRVSGTPGTPEANHALGRKIARQDYGWTGGEFLCLDFLWTKESGWDHTADNPTSSAYGIAQALPGSRMASVGADWQTNPETQIRWGLQYIEDAYGTPCGAWQHSLATNWY